jgi:hypothetical protein
VDADSHPAELAAAMNALPYRRRPPGPAGWRVVVRCGISLRDCAPFAFAGADQTDLGPSLPARVLHTADGTACWIDRHDTLLHLQPRIGTLRAYSANSQAYGYWAMRLLREAITIQLLADGAGVWVCAAACVINGAGVVIAGPPGCGKTGTLLACMQHLDADFVADDRLLVRPDRGGLIGHPWPDALRLPSRLLSAFPELLPHLHEHDPDPGSGEGPSLRVEPGVLADLFGRRPVDRVQPGLLLFPTLQPQATTAPSPQWLRPDVTASLLPGSGLFADPSSVEPPASQRLPGLATSPPHPDARARIAALLTGRVPAAQITVTPDPQNVAAQIADLLRHRGLPR